MQPGSYCSRVCVQAAPPPHQLLTSVTPLNKECRVEALAMSASDSSSEAMGVVRGASK